MARKDVNIGLTGNDGTGDSIRDAFQKVNSNFQELYASQGLEAGLTFDNLVDVIKPLRPSTVLGLDNLGKTIVSRDLVGATGVSIDTTSDPSQIIFSIANVQVSQDENPTLSNDLDAASFKLRNLGAPENDSDATTRKWVYENFLNRDNIDLLGSVNKIGGSTMRANFRIAPSPDNGNPNVGERYITVKGSDGVTNKIDVFLKYQGVDPAHATRKDYVDTKLSLQGTETLDPTTGLVNKGFGVMTGPLILNDHPGAHDGITLSPDGTVLVQEDFRAATKAYVDSKSHSSVSNIFVATSGNDAMWDFDNNRPNPAYGYPEEEIGRSWSKAFKSLNAANRYAKYYMDKVQLQNIPYQLNPVQIQRWNPPFANTEPKTRVRVSLQNHGYQDGDYVLVSGAILGSLDTRNLNGIHRVNALDANNFELNLKSLVTWPQPEVAPGTTISMSLANQKDGPYTASSKVDYGYRGFSVPKPEITIMVESGVYFEEYPIIVPPNVAIKGDEFRRTLVKPKPGPVNARNANIRFVRGDRDQSADFWYNTHYTHQLARSVGTTNIAGSFELEIKNSSYRPKSGMRFVIGATGGVPNVYYVGSEKEIVYKEPNVDENIATGTYTMPIVDVNGDPKFLTDTIPDGSQIEFLLDNEHCDCLLVNDAFQLRNMTFMGSKGFVMSFDPAGQIKTRSPYAQVCATFAGEGGGGQLVDGYAGNQVCYVLDNSYTDPFTGTQGASGQKMTVTGLLRTPEVPNTFYIEKKRYVIIDATTPDANGTSTLTLSSTTPIEVDDVYLKQGFIPNATTIVIQTAGNRSMLSNDFTMVNDLGYGVVCDNNGVAEAVSQFTYYCRVSYLSRAGGQIRSVTGSSCYGLVGLQSEGSDPNEAIQIGRVKSTIGNIVTPYLENLDADGNLGAVGFIVGNVDSKPLRNATFKLNKHEVIIKNIARARLPGGTLTTGPLVVTTTYKHPFSTGDSIQTTAVRGVNLAPIPPSTTPRTTDIDGQAHTITVVDDYTFTLNGTESTDYVSDLGTYEFADLPARAISNLVVGAQDITYTIKGDPSPSNISGVVRFDGIAGENTSGTNILKVSGLTRPAVVGMKFVLPGSSVVYKVREIEDKDVRFKATPRVSPTGDDDNKLGSTFLYISNVTAGWTPVAGWTFQLLDTNLDAILNYDRYTVIGTPTYDAGTDRWLLELDTPLTVSMVNQVASAQWTHVDGLWDLTLDRDLAVTIANSGSNTVIFTDSYWLVSIDPSLANPLPWVANEYNKPIAKKFNLYQQKTISVSQILNRPAIINSSALRFSTSSYDPSIYRILGKTVDGGITEDTYEITTQADPVSGFNTNAVEKLLANKEWIQSEVRDYLATVYPNFQYDVDICYRDVGYIIDAVAFDLTYGGNVRSRAAGISYYQQGNPSAALVLSQQKPETIDALVFATTAALTSLNQYDGATLLQTALPYRGTNLNASAQLIANREFIQEEVIAFLTTTYPGFNYDEDKCRRDTGLILNAVLEDVVLGTNFQSRVAGLAYIRSYSSTVTSAQKTQTIAGLNRARDLAIAIITDADTRAVISTNFAIVTNIINAVSANVAPAISFTDPLNTDSGIINGKNVLQANKSFIQDEIVAYIDSNFVGFTYTTPIQNKCERDIGFIIDAASYDMALGTNFNSVTMGNAYQRNTSAYLQSEQKVQTVAGIRKAQRETEALVNSDPLAVSRVTSAYDTIVDILLNDTPTPLVWNAPVGTSQAVINTRDQLVSNRDFLVAEIVAYVTLNNPAGVDPAICGRDAGYIVDAVLYDILYGGNSASRRAAEAYFTAGTNAVLPPNEVSPTTNAWTRLQNVIGSVIQGLAVTVTPGNTLAQDLSGSGATSTEASTASSRIQIIKDVITAGTLNVLPAVAYPSVSWTTQAIQDAKDSIDDAKSTIIATMSSYITDSFSGFTYNSTVCARDVGLIVDALSYDLLYGGNSQIKVASDAYYFGLTSFIPDQEEVTSLAYTHLKSIVNDIVQNTPVTPTVGNTSTQDTGLTAGSSLAGSTVANLVQLVIDTIQGGPSAAPSEVPPTLSNGANFTTKNADRVLILNSEEVIKNTVINFLNATYSSGFSYNQTTCRRDVGLIVDALVYDLEYEGNVATRTAAIAYYEGSTSANYVLSAQKTQTIAALNRASQVARLIVTESLVTKTSGNNLTQNTSGTPGTSDDAIRVEDLMSIVTDVLQTGTSAAPPRDLGIRRSYQDPLVAGYIAQNIDSGLVAENDADITLIGLMNQINAIIEFGPTGDHIIPSAQVLDTLQSLDFPATATSLQYGGIVTGLGIPQRGVNNVTEDTIVRTVSQLFDTSIPPNVIGYRVRLSAPVTQSIPVGTEITITGPGNDYLFDLNTNLDVRHQSGDVIGITTTFSTVRATGHDFLEVGTGGYDDSNYPHNVYGQAINPPSDGAIVKEVGTGRVFHVSTDQNGNFRVGSYFNVNQGDGSVSISAKIGLSAVTSLSFLTGATVNQFATDPKLDDNSDNIVSTQKAIKTYINNLISGKFTIDNTDTPNKGLLTLDGSSEMVGNINVGLNRIEGVRNSVEIDGVVNRKYVDNVFAGGVINYDGAFELTTTGKRNEIQSFEMLIDNTTTGGVPANRGGIDLNGNKIVRLKAPTQLLDAANKSYVDQAIATGGIRTGWSGFTLNNTTTRYTVSAINIQNNGSNYITPPMVAIYSTSGTGASARAILTSGSGGRSIANIVVDSGGYGYTEAPLVIIGGSVGTATIINIGSGYSSVPTITFSAPQVTGGIQATGYVVMGGTGLTQYIDRVVISNAGCGYTSAPSVTVSGGGSTVNGTTYFPSVVAVITTQLQTGTGATATAIITATPKNIDLNSNKVTNSADPTNPGDLVNLNYFNAQNFIGRLADVTITDTPSSGSFLVFTGTTPQGSLGAMVNASVTTDSDIVVERQVNTISMNIKSGAITNAEVASNAAILQNKLALNKSATVGSAVTPGQNDYGIACFVDTQFTSTEGKVQLRLSSDKLTGVTLDRIQHVTNYTVLGRYNTGEGESSVGTITELGTDSLKAMLGLSSATVATLINDDTLGGLQPDGITASGLALRSNGSTSYGALLKRGGVMRGFIEMTDAGGLPAGDVNITPIIRVSVTDKLDIGSSTLRFRSNYSKNFYGDVFEGSTFGNNAEPTVQGTGARFKGTATYADQSAQTQAGLTGTGVGSGDIAVRNGANSITFNGNLAATISVLADASTTNNSIVRRTDQGQINANQFNGALNGQATRAANLVLGGTDYAPSDTGSSNNTVPLRINGNINATTFTGTASKANYADLAERYQADAEYEPGTVLEFGGEFEVTIAEDETRRVAGVVSTNPAYEMNTSLIGDNVVALALTGRVPCKVRGKIRKGDMLVSGGGGYARPTTDPKIGTIIGKALENFDGVEGIIEVVVGRL